MKISENLTELSVFGRFPLGIKPLPFEGIPFTRLNKRFESGAAMRPARVLSGSTLSREIGNE